MFIAIALTLPFHSLYSQGWAEFQKITHQNAAAGDKYGHSVDISGHFAVVGAPFDDPNTAVFNGNGSAYVYEYAAAFGWQQKQVLTVSAQGYLPRLGWDVCLDTSLILASAYSDATDTAGLNHKNAAGAIYLFRRNTSGTWAQVQKLVASDRDLDDYFGWSTSFRNDRMAIGARFEAHNAAGSDSLSGAGSVYIFEKMANNTWSEVQKIVAYDRETDDAFGCSVDICGDYAVVGAYLEDHNELGADSLNNAGSVYIFQRNGNGTWTEIQKIVAPDREEENFFGCSVSIEDSTLLVGAYGNGTDTLGGSIQMTSGAAYVYRLQPSGTWNFLQKLVASDRSMLDAFGRSVDLYNKRAVIGAFQYNPPSAPLNHFYGAVYVFERNSGGTWNETAKLTASDGASGDKFGLAAAISDSIVISGASFKDAERGAAYFYHGSPLAGMQELSRSKVMLFPNPAKDRAWIDLDSNVPGHGSGNVFIFDNTGRMVSDHAFTNQSSKLQIETSRFPAGFYLVKVMFVSGDVFVSKLIVR